ncbi:VWA domain-containing protein [Streptomyces sp. KLOTTS4A1]|uniref:VWA domain-containing protein n=1 Tax=Streptomyces sp. KLOTTS4A1 TaxID=3390996 RepID=UPI0039F44C0E
MGILDRLRNVFGRGRVPAAATEESSAPSATEPTIPSPSRERAPEPAPEPAAEPAAEPATEPGAEATTESASSASVPAPAQEPKPSTHDDLVSAAFDNPSLGSVPSPATPVDPAPAAEPTAASEPTASVGTVDASAETEADSSPATTAEVEAEAGAKDDAEDEADATSDRCGQASREATDSAETDAEVHADTAPAPVQEPALAEEPAPAAEVAPAAEAAPEPTSEAAPEPAAEVPAAAGKPASTLARVKGKAPGLATAYKAAGAVLRKQGLTGARATVYLVLDRSGSMRPYYKDGSAQNLADQTLALAAHVHTGETPTGPAVDVVFFSTELDGTGTLTLEEHEGRVDALHAGLGRMGRTNYDRAIAEVIALHEKSDDPDRPALVIFQTDGAPESKTATTQALKAAAEHNIFWQFVAFGETEAKAFDYLRRLDLDNTGFFHAGPAPNELTDTELFKGLLATWRP